MNTIETPALKLGYRYAYKAAERDMAELLKDKARLDWLLNTYTLSWAPTRTELDEKMTELGE